MLAFHGTGGDRALIDKILAEGLVPASRPWAHDLTGIERHVFACTTPVGTRGGDPIHFAQRRAWREQRAWLFVLDVKPELVHGAIPNGELEQYWRVRTFQSIAFHDRHATREVIERARAERRSARELLAYRVKKTVEGLCAGEPDAATLVQFEGAYLRASAATKARVAASYSLAIPDWFAGDSHYPWCAGCMHNLFEVEIVAGEHAFSRGAWDRLDPTMLGAMFDVLGAWLAAHGDPKLPSDLRALEAKHPPPRDRVPRTWWTEFATADVATRMRLPDTQLLLDHVPPAAIVGAIDIGSGDRLSAFVRPHEGEVLIDKLRYLARQLVERRAATGRPSVVA